MTHTIFTWSEWDAPKGRQPVASEVLIEYLYRNPEDDKIAHNFERCGQLNWSLDCGIVSYRYQILEPV